MIYFILKPFIRIALAIFCPKIQLNQVTPVRHLNGPLLIVANHPNSFLDAIIIASLFKKPVHFLARGDAFTKPWHRILLGLLNMFPIYRLREGKEYLHLNANAFENTRKILRKNGIVLIFIEGICVNKHSLQPFKKGAARIAQSCWNEKIPLNILPLGIAYNSFKSAGKSVSIQTGVILKKQDLMYLAEEAKNFVLFNQLLYQKIQNLILLPSIQPKLKIFSKYLSYFGKMVHKPIYRIISSLVRKKTKNTVFYDSILFGCLFFCYPLLLIIITIILIKFKIHYLLIIVIMILFPLLAYFAALSKISEKRQ